MYISKTNMRGRVWLSSIQGKKAMYHASPKDQFIIHTYHLKGIRNVVIITKREKRDSKIFHGIGLREQD